MNNQNFSNNQSGKNKAVAALVLGIAALVVAWFGYGAILAIALAIVGIILAVGARKELPPGQTGMATAGLVCSIVALVLSSVVFIACVLCAGALALLA